MGCDIHMYVEYGNIEDNKKRIEKGEEPYWQSFGGRINPGRDYILFGYLSQGVRYDTEKGFEARGLPDGLGYWSRSESRYYIVANDEEKFEGAVKLSTAIQWHHSYGCELTYDKDGNPTHVGNPDWHSHSWLTTKEFEKAIKLCQRDKNTWGISMQYKALLAAMKSLERSKTHEARVVFWFDN